LKNGVEFFSVLSRRHTFDIPTRSAGINALDFTFHSIGGQANIMVGEFGEVRVLIDVVINSVKVNMQDAKQPRQVGRCLNLLGIPLRNVRQTKPMVKCTEPGTPSCLCPLFHSPSGSENIGFNGWLLVPQSPPFGASDRSDHSLSARHLATKGRRNEQMAGMVETTC